VKLTPEYKVKDILGNMISAAFRPPAFFHSAGGINAGGIAALSTVNDENVWRRRISINEISE
jgi:hypothetical protein